MYILIGTGIGHGSTSVGLRLTKFSHFDEFCGSVSNRQKKEKSTHRIYVYTRIFTTKVDERRTLGREQLQLADLRAIALNVSRTNPYT